MLIQLMRGDAEIKALLIASYRLMLDFYGIELLDENTGDVGRTAVFAARYTHLNQCV